MTTIESVLRRSDELDQAMFALLDPAIYDSSPRSLITSVMCDIALEHVQSLRVLVIAAKLTSAISLIRLQFEATARAIWVLYPASELSISRLHAPLSEGSERAAGQPTISEMIKQIGQKAPPAVGSMLAHFKDVSWEATNSYVHSGIHALSRHGDGYPTTLVI